MKALELVGLLALVIAPTAMYIRYVGAVRRRRLANADWEVRDRAQGGRCHVELVRPGEDALHVGEVDEGDPDYDDKYTDLMLKAEERKNRMNATRRSLRA
jgi:hypothetical protein